MMPVYGGFGRFHKKGINAANSETRYLVAAHRGDDAHREGTVYVFAPFFGWRRAIEKRGQSVTLFLRKL